MVCNMQKKRNNRGFTMAELLIVVAIITVLSGVGFIAVQTYQKSMSQMECNAVAKEIFIAAQNHLTMAESQGYLGANVNFGTPEDAASGIYYYSVTGSNSDTAFGGSSNDSVLELMLPFGSIDETIRKGGNYIIRYQTNPAIVLDVCYASPTGRYGGSITYAGVKSLFGAGPGKEIGGVNVGWYGGAEAKQAGQALNAPVITVDNAERLIVTVDATNVNRDAANAPIIADDKYALKLLISNLDGTAMAAITLHAESVAALHERIAIDVNNSDKYVITLDDITAANLRFCDIAGDATIDKQGTFKPGEDIIVSAVAYSNSALSNIAYSNQETVNSLFADVEEQGVPAHKIALIANFRHFENLDNSLSGLDAADLKLAEAKQIEDLVWASETDANAFTNKISVDKGVDAAAVQVFYKKNETVVSTQAGCFLPVSPDYALTYDGNDGYKYPDPNDATADPQLKSHSITGVKVGTSATQAYDGAGALFGAPTVALTVRNLALIDFEINASGNAGALAGTLPAGSSVTNVIAYNIGISADATVTSTGGSAGGLIGSMTDTTVKNSAAALVVTGSTNAGGLIGTAAGGTITASFAGGHTTGGKYTTDNVTATGTAGIAGGLVGSDTARIVIEQSYSTCSVSGNTAGGFVGTRTGSISDCYCTGKVTGTTRGAFAGSEGEGSYANCLYYDIINEENSDGVISYLPAVPGPIAAKDVSALDATAETFNTFALWDENAVTYDSTLANFYSEDTGDGRVIKYLLKTVAQLGATVNATATATAPADFVATHYGDWPAPETYVLNTGSNVGSNSSNGTGDLTF